MGTRQEQPLSPAQLIEQFRQEGVNRVGIGITSLDGLMLGKYVNAGKFAAMARDGSGWCDCIFGWDLDDKLYDHLPGCIGCTPGYPDAPFKLDLSTLRRVPDENRMPLFLGEFVDRTGNEPHPICPRSVLRRVLRKAESMGFAAKLSFEYEFFLFRETPESIEAKGFRNLQPHSHRMCGYSMLRNSTLSELWHGLMDYCMAMDMELEALHNETGPGVMEACFCYDDALRACDKAALFKTFGKAFLHKRGVVPTFMAKWNTRLPGQGGHLHQSLWSLASGDNAFHAPGRPHNMSDVMAHFVAGQLRLLKPLLAVFAPTINSYRRLVKGSWAPTSATWGVDNRTLAIRAIPGKSSSQRVEHRLPASDANPYLAAAAALAAGLYGIEHRLALPPPATGNVYRLEGEIAAADRLPTSLREAAKLLDASHEARALLGDDFVTHFVTTRLWEADEYEGSPDSRTETEYGVSLWELKRYFELI